MNQEVLGKLVRQRREELGLQQQDLAEMGGLTAKTLYLVESGRGNPSLQTLLRLLEVLGLELSVHLRKTGS
ncbi:helix-turn-helix transcriptional regulator [Paraflavisolibacter sp. H34]|uniref:helix-turn-helix transcriptional regulator n=1 Tax=Huijunlia imazamoxiresistens TaxID=3127457 RepID=UPI0030184A0E